MSNNLSRQEQTLVGILQSPTLSSVSARKEYLHRTLFGKTIVIYGAGAFGKEVLNYLTGSELQPVAFIDSFKNRDYCGLRTFHPSEFHDKNVAVVLGVVVSKSTRFAIEQDLRKNGFFNIIDGQFIRAHYVDYYTDHVSHNLFAESNEILRPLSLFADNHSVDIYYRNLIAHFKRDYSMALESEGCMQYLFSKSLTSGKPVTYIDCGAYIGDTFNLLVSNGVNLSHYIGFEPIRNNYQELVTTVSASSVRATLLPLAVSDRNCAAKFSNNTGSSAISNSGDVDAMYAVPDEILHNTEVDFIKMDVEGDEPNALRGCLQTIKRCKPELAISVYHKINHYWEIPNWINELGLGYKLYMRTHSSACMETVLYAVHD